MQRDGVLIVSVVYTQERKLSKGTQRARSGREAKALGDPPLRTVIRRPAETDFQPGAGSDTCPVTLSTTISVSRQVIRGSLP